jgi:hypothetical protein
MKGRRNLILFFRPGKTPGKIAQSEIHRDGGTFLQRLVYAFCMESRCLRGPVRFLPGFWRDYYGFWQHAGHVSATTLQQTCNNSATTLQQLCNNSATTLQQTCNKPAIIQQAFSKQLKRQLPCIHNASALPLQGLRQLKSYSRKKSFRASDRTLK